MTLDLDELTAGWHCPPGELRARVVVGRDGQELVQLRVDLGLMQMFIEGRPDGQRYRGLPSDRQYIQHELQVGGQLTADDWRELERELVQTNYRRMALATVAEEALGANDPERACGYIRQALSDIDECLSDLGLIRQQPGSRSEPASLEPALVFDRGRLAAQLCIAQGRFEEAIEQAEAGAEQLGVLLSEVGCDEEQREEDPGLRYLRGLGVQLRREYGVAQTLRERLAEAVENEDFETAAQLRDELAARHQRQSAASDASGDQPQAR